MAAKIENYALLSDWHGSALVSHDGDLDWLCVPRFDSDASMAALLGRDEHGCWSIYPAAEVRKIERRYRPGTMILETDYHCDGGAVRLIDFMPLGENRHRVVRILEGLEGEVSLDFNVGVRFGFGRYAPWIHKQNGDVLLTTSPDSFAFRTPSPIEIGEHNICGAAKVKKGERIPFELAWYPVEARPPQTFDNFHDLDSTSRTWAEWSERSTFKGPYQDLVNQSLLALKAMIYEPSGGIVAAPTAGLPEEIGGVRNWDYRFCWIRDSSLTLEALLAGGYLDEAVAWRTWVLNAVAGAPDDLQIMYGVEGERRLSEFELKWLPGYEESRPVRIGNAASDQFQLDVYGELLQTVYKARSLGVPEEPLGLTPGMKLLEFVSQAWQRPDDGIWEVRGGRQHFVHSKVMAWVAMDRFIRLGQEFFADRRDYTDLLPRYRALRDRIHRDICEHGFNPRLNSFTQAYNSEALDASLLLIPALGFLPADDPRVLGTIRAIEKDLMRDGFVLRYNTDHTEDGLAGSEGAFLACSFWLVDAYAYTGRRREAEELFGRLVGLRNDLGLLAEEYEPRTGRLVGNFPQAFSHLALIHSASVLTATDLAGSGEKADCR
jgi:GH15 family glucan-1,4-alpha-glucosidase